jgi:GntR family transcriptional repressor for pyruvate dehydrogenase complex
MRLPLIGPLLLRWSEGYTMTRQATSAAAIPPLPLLRPLAPPRNRTAQVAGRIAAEIAEGRYRPGDRLPTEQAMMAAMGVSRTVIREAVAALRADGLVTTRQGLGAFVATDLQRQPFRIAPEDIATVADVLGIMELRTAVETETAGLAAERGTAPQRRAVWRCLEAIGQAMDRGETAIEEDAAFHRAIARASGNAQFVRLLDYLGRFIIPRHAIRAEADRLSDQHAYMRTFQAEHCVIGEAIMARDPMPARQAMRLHLTNSSARYRRLAEAAKVLR